MNRWMTPTAAQKWLALLRMRCPHCCDGKIYQRGMNMNQRCPVCDLAFERDARASERADDGDGLMF